MLCGKGEGGSFVPSLPLWFGGFFGDGVACTQLDLAISVFVFSTRPGRVYLKLFHCDKIFVLV